MLYDLYVGSTESHYAHSHSTMEFEILHYLRNVTTNPGQVVTVWDVYGVWEGVTEGSTIYSLELADDATAQRVAYALAMLTDNDAVLVTRAIRSEDEHPSFNSVRRFRASIVTRTTGNRTLWLSHPSALEHDVEGMHGNAFEPDVKGSHVAYLVNAPSATVTNL